MKVKIISFAAAIALVLSMSLTAKADTLDWQLASGLMATENISTSGNSFTITFTITNTSSTNAGIYDFSLGIAPGGSINVSSITGTGTGGTGFEFFANEKQNNGSGDTCSTNSIGGWMCVDYHGNFNTISANGGTLTYVITGTFTKSIDLDPHLMAQGCVDTSDTWVETIGHGRTATKVTHNCPYNGDGSFNISLDGTPRTNVPEPSSLMLFGAGILGFAGFMRRRISK